MCRDALGSGPSLMHIGKRCILSPSRLNPPNSLVFVQLLDLSMLFWHLLKSSHFATVHINTIICIIS